MYEGVNMKNKLKATRWGIQLAWKINKRMLLLWTILRVIIAVLPAVALLYYQSVVAQLSTYLSAGTGGFSDIIPVVIMLGVILTISGLSTRLNDDLLYMVMFDAYYLGLEEVMMDSAQRIRLNELLKKEVNDDYFGAISRVGSLTDLVSSGCVLIAKMVSILALMIVAFQTSVFLFFITLIYVLGVLWLNFHLSDRVRVVWKDMRDCLRRADYFEKLPQSGDTAKEVRIYSSSEQVKDDWEEAYKKVEDMEKRRTAGMAKLTFWSKAGFYVFMSGMIGYGIFAVEQGHMQAAVLLMIYTLCLNIAEAVSGIPKSYQRMDYGLYGLDLQRRFFEFTPATDPKEEAKKTEEPLDESVCFEMKNLCFSYNDTTPVIKNVNLKIKKGDTVALVGANGSGKTTLIKLMLGLYLPTAGDIKFMGRNYTDYKNGFISKKIGSFFQDFYLFHLTIGENVGIGSIGVIDKVDQIKKAMEKGGSFKLLDKLKMGLDQRLGKQVYKDGVILSGGEGQRVAVSRTHMSDKDILIFDEPASMLDPIAEMEQFSYIKEKIQERTAILVSHRIGFARLADRILVLDKGQIIEDGNHEELLERNGMYARLFQEQAQWYNMDES
jgi:ATP-binding cassette subfamily B protein